MVCPSVTKVCHKISSGLSCSKNQLWNSHHPSNRNPTEFLLWSRSKDSMSCRDGGSKWLFTEITMLLLKVVSGPAAWSCNDSKPKWKLSGARLTRWFKGCNVFPRTGLSTTLAFLSLRSLLKQESHSFKIHMEFKNKYDHKQIKAKAIGEVGKVLLWYYL